MKPTNSVDWKKQRESPIWETMGKGVRRRTAPPGSAMKPKKGKGSYDRKKKLKKLH